MKMKSLLPLLISDSYKQGHHRLYPKNIEYVASNMTGRSTRVEGQEFVVVFGIRYFVKKYLIDAWEEFFNTPIEDVLKEYHRVIDNHLGPNVISDENVRYLHSLGYLPIKMKSLPEGTKCPIGVPICTFINTDPKCAWLTNFLETISQTILWKPMTSATTAYRYRQLLDEYADETSDCPEFVTWQGHDFSMRGTDSLEGCQTSGMAHLLSFTGTDTIPAIIAAEEYYGADIEKELIGCSVTASEHSIQCSYFDETSEDEHAYIQAMLDAQPEGIVSIVSDGYDYWKMITETFPSFKDKILARKGKVVVRPDTGDPVKIVTGYFVKDTDYTSGYIKHLVKTATGRFEFGLYCFNDGNDAIKTKDGIYMDEECNILTEAEVRGTIAILAEHFGAVKNSKGYYELNPAIGCIYGDSITFERASKICERLMLKGYASTNIVFGIGSYTYQYVTRDTYGFAFKATWVQVGGKEKAIFKDPKTGDGKKKSAKGLLKVYLDKKGNIVYKDNCTKAEEETGLLMPVFVDGKEYNIPSFKEIRERLLT